jgi:hypothetical protein
MKIPDKIYWFIQDKINNSRTTKLMIAFAVVLIIVLACTGKLFTDIPHWINRLHKW